MKWKVTFCDAFELEFNAFSQIIQDELLAYASLLQEFGPSLGRPYVDTLKNSQFANMKELRFKADDGIWRVAFAFDLSREAVLLIAGNKARKSEQLFYRQLIKKADKRYKDYLELSRR